MFIDGVSKISILIPKEIQEVPKWIKARHKTLLFCVSYVSCVLLCDYHHGHESLL